MPDILAIPSAEAPSPQAETVLIPAAPPARDPARALARAALPPLLIAAVLCLVTFIAGGGLLPATITPVEMALTLGGGVAIAVAVLLTPAGRPLRGAWPAGLILALTALTAISVAWSVTPNVSWREASQMLSYSAVFIAAIAAARLARRRSDAVIAGVVLASVVICAYALATKALPAHLDAGDVYARLRAPYEYWNAIGLTAAMGIVACLWLGARRAGHALVSASAYPAMGLMIVTLLLSYSRGSLAVAVLGVVVWMLIVPLRLRGAILLIVAGVGAACVVAFDFSNASLTSEGVALASRTSAGHRLGAILIAMVVVLAAAGVAVGFARGRSAPTATTRRRAGAALLAAVALAVLAAIGGLAASERGLTGTISHAVSALTNPNATVPSNTPGRLTSVGSARARYWKQALQVFDEHPVLGAGAGGYATARLRYKTENLAVKHAHGYAVQTLADLGLVGAAVSLALLTAWLIAAGAATHPFNRRWSSWRWRREPLPYGPERVALLSMLCVVITFGLHSLEDWTWYIPGTACTALLCAGWLAGRGRIERSSWEEQRRRPQDDLHQAAPGPRRPRLGSRWLAGSSWWPGDSSRQPGDSSRQPGDSSRQPGSETLLGLDLPRVLAAGAAIALAVVSAWAQWQPLRSEESSQQALALISSNPQSALAAARRATSQDPLSPQAASTLATVQLAAGQHANARATLLQAVESQPANPATWLALGEFDLTRQPRSALREFEAALYLNPDSVTTRNQYLLALRATQAPGT